VTAELTHHYEFEHLPLEPIPAGTNILLSGSNIGGTDQLLLDILSDNDGKEGLMFISTDHGAQEIVELYEASGRSFDPNRMCILDCTKEGTSHDGPIREIATPADLTGIGMEFSSLFESLRQREYPKARIGLNSVSTLLLFTEDFRPVYRFLHTLTSRIRTGNGLGVATIDPDATDERALGTVAQAFDARIDVRESGEFRIRGLDDQPDGWLSLP